MSKMIDMTNQRFGRLLVLEQDFTPRKSAHVHWKCLCDCGEETVVSGSSLRSGATQSCGCFRKEQTVTTNTTHGDYGKFEHRVWRGMLKRCHNPSQSGYVKYGAKGIEVCDRWKDSYENFLADMGRCPADKSSIERRNNAKGYEPGNCKWADDVEQANNKSTNRMLTHNGKTQTLAQWAKELGMNQGTLKARIDDSGWSVEDALTKPVQRKNEEMAI